MTIKLGDADISLHGISVLCGAARDMKLDQESDQLGKLFLDEDYDRDALRDEVTAVLHGSGDHDVQAWAQKLLDGLS